MFWIINKHYSYGKSKNFVLPSANCKRFGVNSYNLQGKVTWRFNPVTNFLWFSSDSLLHTTSLGIIVPFLKNCVSRETFLLNKLSLVNVTLCHCNNFSATRQIYEIENLAIFENSSYKNKWWPRKELLVLLKNSIKTAIFGLKIMLYFLAKTAF